MRLLRTIRRLLTYYERQKIVGRLNLVFLLLLSMLLIGSFLVLLSLYTVYESVESISALGRFEKQIDEIRLAQWRFRVTHERTDALVAKDLLDGARNVLLHLPPDVLFSPAPDDQDDVGALLGAFEARYREYLFDYEQSVALQSGMRKAVEDLLAGVSMLEKEQKMTNATSVAASLKQSVLSARILQQEFVINRNLGLGRQMDECIDSIVSASVRLRASTSDVNTQIEAYGIGQKARLMGSAFGKLRDYTIKNAVSEESMNKAATAISKRIGKAVERQRQSISRQIYLIISSIVGVLAFVVLLGLVLGRRMVRNITVPLTRLVQITGEMAQGCYDHPLVVESEDEIGELAKSFNSMAKTVKQHIDTLQASEQQVRLRTDELEVANRLLAAAKQAVEVQNESLEAKVLMRTAELEEANRKLSELTVTDALTGLANRRRFDAVFADEWSRACRSKQPLAILMLDIDFFKNYNDHYGHQAGDECLRNVARVLQTSARRVGDLVARYGGEEFVVVAANSDLKTAQELAETMRRSVELLSLPHEESLVAKLVTVSIGFAVIVPNENWQAARLLHMADDALYRAKNAGRNCVSA